MAIAQNLREIDDAKKEGANQYCKRELEIAK